MSRAPDATAHTIRRRMLLAGLLLAAFVVLGRGFQLAVLDHRAWTERALDQHHQQLTLPAPRGVIYDRSGVPLAASREVYRIAIAPREISDTTEARRRLQQALGLGAAQARRLVVSKRRWIVIPDRYDAVARQRLEGVHGLHFERSQERFYPRGALALELLGTVASDGRALGGLEQELDSVLRGTPGIAVARRDARGRPVPGALLSAQEPVPGHDVYLTLDADLQEIAQQALGRAVEETGAEGGDLVIADPRTGEILAAVSRRVRGSRQWRAVTEPYEPGSTLKPFVVAALLAERRASLGDSVFAEEGRWTHDGRTVTDVHGYGWLTLGEALEVSSNIGIIKVASRLDAGVQYRYLRDFGFGTPTGVSYPVESSGLLRHPRGWSRYSQGSLAIGYEIAVTPLQMAMAYGALANGGVVLEPRLLREVRSRDGRTSRTVEPRVIRRVIPDSVARQVSEVLVDVVAGGTGQQAGLGTFRVAGKTGTARRTRGGRYESGAYTASFAGFFPADDPQLVFLVKLDNPEGAYYGGSTAAPVMRATLAAALAAWSSPLDRSAVATPVAMEAAEETVARASTRAPEPGPYIFTLDSDPVRRDVPDTLAAPSVPSVAGLSLRDAARRLQTAGFRVRVRGGGVAGATVPAAGQVAPHGTVVELYPVEGAR